MDYGAFNQLIGREVDQAFWGTRTEHIVGVAACLAVADHGSQKVFSSYLGRELCFAKVRITVTRFFRARDSTGPGEGSEHRSNSISVYGFLNFIFSAIKVSVAKRLPCCHRLPHLPPPRTSRQSPAAFVAHTFFFIAGGVTVYCIGDAALNPLVSPPLRLRRSFRVCSMSRHLCVYICAARASPPSAATDILPPSPMSDCMLLL